jgi:hypothetical protein
MPEPFQLLATAIVGTPTQTTIASSVLTATNALVMGVVMDVCLILRPRIGFKANIISGDRNPNDRRTFNALFRRGDISAEVPSSDRPI